MTVNINATLNLDITDFLLLQEISEMKLNRVLGNDPLTNNPIKFYDSYLDDSNNINDITNQFYVAVGAQNNLNNNSSTEYIGGAGAYTKISQTQADYFLDNFKILDYYGNDNTGFSATTFIKNSDILEDNGNKKLEEITISFRSTEFTEDYYKDAAGADTEINDNGTAIAQNIALVNYLKKLKTDGIITPNTKINITGYSLGGHLASSAYQYLTADGYYVKQLYVFNGPGVGNVLTPGNANSSTVTNNFGYLEQDLLNYTQIINMFNILKSQNISTTEDALSFVNQNSNNQLVKDFFNNSTVLADLLKLLTKNLNNTLLESATLQIYDSTTNSYTSHENELLRDFNTSQNKDESYLEKTVYKSDLYLTFKKYIINKYNMTKAGAGGNTETNTATMDETLLIASQSEKTGVFSPNLFGNNATWLNGQSSVNNYDYMGNDFNFVSNSNRYGNNLDIVIEDRPETENGFNRVPIAESITKYLTGDFGNTHSITLLNKSLNLMKTLANLEGKTTIDLSKYSSLISSSTKERAAHFYNSSDVNLGTGDYDAISNIINTLTKILLPNENCVMFDSTLGGWADINKINQLDILEKKLISLNKTINVISFYNIKSDDLSRTNFNSTAYDYMSKSDIITKAKTNVAYRYALDNLNTFVIEGADYSNYLDSYHSDEWYSSRTDILLKIIDANVQNSNNYMSNEDIKLTTNIYVNDNQQDLLFVNYNQNSNINYKIYNDSYYAQSRASQKLTSFDSSLQYTINTAVNQSKLKLTTPLINGFYSIIHESIIKDAINDNDSPDLVNSFNYVLYNISKLKPFKNSMSYYLGNYTNRSSLSINKNIYFLDNSTSDYISNNFKNKDENIFINVDKNILYSYIQGYSTQDNQYFDTTKYKIKEGQSVIQSVNDIVLTHNVNLGAGNDYIEIDDDGEATISSTSGKKNYYLKGSKTYITDPDKKGTITLDGILLNGGDMVMENGFVNPNKRVQIYYSNTELDELGNPKAYKITYQFNRDGYNSNYYIENEQTGHQVIITGLSNFGNGQAFGFKQLASGSFIGEKTFSQEDFNNTFSYSPSMNYTNKNIGNYYDQNTDFESLFNIDINIDNENMVFTRNPDNKKDLVVYDKNNPHNIHTIADFFDELGVLKEHSYYIIDGNNYTLAYSHFKINHAELSTLLHYNPTMSSGTLTEPSSENIANGYSGYDLNTSIDTVLNYSPYAKYFIDNSIISSTGFRKEGNDLVLYSLDFNNPYFINGVQQTGKNVIKNYFSFDHSNNTNFYIHRYGQNIPLSSSDLMQRMAVRLNENSSNYVMDENSYKTVVTGVGDDTIVGTSANETFISTTVIDFNNGVGSSYSDGNDTFTGGGGADIYSFSGNFGYDTITDFNNDSTIYIDNSYQSTDYQFMRQGNDLIIYKDLDTNITQDYSQVTVKDYFSNIDYQSNSRIIFTRNQEHFSQLYNDSNYVPESYYYFDSSDIQSFNTTDLNKTSDELLEQTSKDNTNNTFDTTKLTSSHIKGNDLDNTIIIRNNDTIIHSNQTSALTDGDDTYIIDIAANEAMPLNHNNYRTTIEFGFNSGHDTLLNATFKQMAQYGDIIDLKDIDTTGLTVNAIKDDGNVVVGFNLILQDGSSLLVSVNDLSDTNVDMVKTNSGILKLSNLLSMSSPSAIMGDSMNNSFDLSSSIKSVSINGLDGNDLIIGGQADDIIEGGRGFDKLQFTKGNDTYKFGANSDVDTFDMTNLSSNDILSISAKFLIDNSYKTNGVSYAYNAQENEGYLKLSESDGVVFSNVSWSNFVLLINNINIQFNDGTSPDMNVDYTNDFPFVPSVKVINGTSGTDYLQTNGIYSSVIYGKDGNDTIVSSGNSNHTVNYLIGGKGSDTITANDGDFVFVKDGDGADTIKTTDRSFVLEILHNTPRLVNNQETLFDVSAVSSSSNDLKLKYGGSTDTITIKDYFASNNNEITVALYDNTNNKTYVYDNLATILSNMGLTKSYLLSHGATTVYKNNTTADLVSPTGQLIGGEIAYQYLTGNYLQDQTKINHIIDNQLNGQPLQNKIYS